MAELRIPSATYRIQLNLNFRFVDGRDIVPYLNELGITDFYSSPHFKARRGSPHAYDVANPLMINSEIGAEHEFDELAKKLQSYGMGLVLDIVPNHMAASAENPWWLDVLENGRCSIYASYFAIDWDRSCVKTQGPDKVVLPILGDLYGAALENDEFSLKLDENGFYLRYYDKRLPIDPRSYRHILEPCLASLQPTAEGGAENALRALAEAARALPASVCDSRQREERHRRKEELKRDLWRLYNELPEFKAALDHCIIQCSGNKEDPRSFDQIDRIISDQPYRPAYWRVAAEELNYRRFFDITDLIGLRVEDPAVFDARHPEILRVIAEGKATGLRIDHIDGLWDPAAYLSRLHARASGEDGQASRGCEKFFIVVEKILGAGEDMPPDWEVCGTTGYDFLNQLNGIFVDPEGLKKLGETYERLTGVYSTMGDIQYQRKKQAMDELFPGEVRALGFHLGRLATQDRFARDLPLNELVQALVEVTAWLPIYRTYSRSREVSERDRRYIDAALEAAEKSAPAVSPGVFPFLRRVLLLEIPHYVQKEQDWINFVMGWQQFTGPVMAKGFEDTACYFYNRLISQNEVGCDPELADQPAGIQAFHERSKARLSQWPNTMNATSTHDTKRSEDVRARINVLSELPDVWSRRVARWASLNDANRQDVQGRKAPDRNDEILLYQTMVGAWPLCDEDVPGFRDRLKNFAQKAVREAKTNSNWLRPNEPYENALLSFIDAILDPSESNAFLKDFRLFQKRIAPSGAVNALAQVLLKITSPGIPDFYQGSELWDFSLVDPDNRRPVDFTKRAALLDEIRRRELQDLTGLITDLATNWQDGRIKLYVTYKGLNFRRAHAELYKLGEYLPLEGEERACAFARRHGDAWAVTAAPRLTACPGRPPRRLLAHVDWSDAALALPPDAPRRWRDVFTGAEIEGARGLRLAEVFAAFPAALLEGV